jgi:molybdopterin converting factor small subunit
MVTINLWSGLRRLADGHESVTVEGQTVAQALKALVAQHPGLSEVIAAGVSVLVNGEAVVNRHAGLPEGATLHLLQQMKGG